jgi:hypothetical protein
MSIALKIVLAAIEEVNDGVQEDLLISKLPDAELMGGDASPDSLTLIRLFIAIERFAEEMVGKEITIVDDSAFDAEESPLATVQSLTQHVEKLILDQ